MHRVVVSRGRTTRGSSSRASASRVSSSANNDNGRSDRATEVYLESDGMLAYIDWWKGLSDAGYYTYTGLQRDWDGTSNAYLAGEVAMLVYSSSDTTFFDTNAEFDERRPASCRTTGTSTTSATSSVERRSGCSTAWIRRQKTARLRS